jgi:SAM-dependent methyltransferase
MFKRVEEFHQERACGSMESARRYAEMAERLPFQYKGFLKELKALGIKGRYLEIGPGPGVLAAIIAQDNLDIQITGVELSPDMASVAREYVGRKGLGGRVQFVVGDAEDEDLINMLGKFDLIYGTYTLHHWKDPQKVICNLMGAIADDGVLYLHDLRRVWWLYWVPIRSGFWDSIRAAYVAKEIRAMLQELSIDGYEIKKVFPFTQSIVVRK